MPECFCVPIVIAVGEDAGKVASLACDVFSIILSRKSAKRVA